MTNAPIQWSAWKVFHLEALFRSFYNLICVIITASHSPLELIRSEVTARGLLEDCSKTVLSLNPESGCRLNLFGISAITSRSVGLPDRT